MAATGSPSRLNRANSHSIVALFAYFIFFSFAYLRLDAGSGALILIGAVQLTMFSVAFWEGGQIFSGLAMDRPGRGGL